MRKKKQIIVGKKQSQWADVWFQLNKNKTAMLGLYFIIAVVLLAVFANFIANYNTRALAQNAAERMQSPSWLHLFGTDQFGRDLFARIIYGARYSLIFGVVCTIIALIGGGILGAASAFYGGVIDSVIMRTMDAIMCIPGILLALALIAALGPGLTNIMIAIVIATIPGFSRIVRSAVLTVVRMEYIEAAKACGVGTTRIILLHVLPNAIGTIVVNATMNIASLILLAASLSFIGMGIQPPAPEWGSMLNEAVPYMRPHPYLVIFPGVAILLTALAFNLLGDGLVDAVDPRMRE